MRFKLRHRKMLPFGSNPFLSKILNTLVTGLYLLCIKQFLTFISRIRDISYPNTLWELFGPLQLRKNVMRPLFKNFVHFWRRVRVAITSFLTFSWWHLWLYRVSVLNYRVVYSWFWLFFLFFLIRSWINEVICYTMHVTMTSVTNLSFINFSDQSRGETRLQFILLCSLLIFRKQSCDKLKINWLDFCNSALVSRSRVVNGPASSGPNLARTRKLIWSPNHTPKKRKLG